MSPRRALLVVALALAIPLAATERRLPTGVRLDPAAPSHRLGNMPLGVALARDHRFAAVLLCGYRQQGVQLVDRDSGAVVQTLEQPAAYIGIAFAPDGRTLWTSGGNDDALYRYRYENGRLTPDGKVALAEKADPKKSGTKYPAAFAFSADGAQLYVAENLGDSVAVVDVAQGKVVQRLDAGRYPYGVAVTKSGVYVSAWSEHAVYAFTRNADGTLAPRTRIDVARHPSAILASADGRRVYAASATSDAISVIDTKSAKRIATIYDAPPNSPREGSTPNALALSRDGKRLFVAEADNNAVAIYSTATHALLGRIPTEWYPSALEADGDALVVVTAKGSGSGPNPEMSQPGQKLKNPAAYPLGQLDGSLTTLRANASGAELAALSRRVASANGWNAKRAVRPYPPFRHVIYVIKENRTYDQLFGDVEEGDGDPSLVFFGREVTPNHHALAARFGLFDRFFVNAEVSAHGHNWSTAAYVNDYTMKSVPQQYAGKGRTYDYEGTNRGHLLDDDDDDVASPSTGYLWDLALRKGISFRNYGEFVADPSDFGGISTEERKATKKALAPHTNFRFAPYDMSIPDQQRVDAWMADFEQFVVSGMPALQIVRLPNDHTMGAAAGQRTPRAYMADNDLAVGRIVAAVSHSRFWRDTLILVLEDDAQNGPDHVDSHRSVLLAISAYNRPGAIHRFVNTTDVLATIEEVLGLAPMSQFDRFGRPLRDVFATTPDLRPYDVLPPLVDLNERNPPNTPAAKASALLDLDEADEADDEALNRVLWMAIKGDDVPYPGATRAPMGR